MNLVLNRSNLNNWWEYLKIGTIMIILLIFTGCTISMLICTLWTTLESNKDWIPFHLNLIVVKVVTLTIWQLVLWFQMESAMEFSWTNLQCFSIYTTWKGFHLQFHHYRIINCFWSTLRTLFMSFSKEDWMFHYQLMILWLSIWLRNHWWKNMRLLPKSTTCLMWICRKYLTIVSSTVVLKTYWKKNGWARTITRTITKSAAIWLVLGTISEWIPWTAKWMLSINMHLNDWCYLTITKSSRTLWYRFGY